MWKLKRWVSVSVCFVALIILLPLGAAQAQSVTVPVDIRSSYIQVLGWDLPYPPVIVDLRAHGFLPGTKIYMTVTGQGCVWTIPPKPTDCPMTAAQLPILGVFSKTATVYHPYTTPRIPDAIDSGSDYGTAFDIPQDFRIVPTGIMVTVPEGANYLILGFPDIYYADNTGTMYVNMSPAEPPIANAGPDQAVNEGTIVSLDGSGSIDPYGGALAYSWLQVSGVPVSLNTTDPVHPFFQAPAVSAGGSTATFQLIVNNGNLTSTPALVNITFKNVNHPPIADAGLDKTVAENSVVVLDGSGSYDPDGESITYAWVQTAGPEAQILDATAVRPTFQAPFVGRDGTRLTFDLIVSDGIDTSKATVHVVVENINHPPVADAGTDQTKDEGSVVLLNGTASHDPDNDPISAGWSQLSGPPVSLSDPSSLQPTFVAPLVGLGGEDLVFQLVVNDGLAESAPAPVKISILNLNDPPACDKAVAVPAIIWPPNHKMTPVTISGISDPNNDSLRLTITKVTQDEPTDGGGDGDTSPDAVSDGSKALLRAERSGTGNGRVYQIDFTADDGQGGLCSGIVKVGVPHSSNRQPAIDDGQLYDSLQP